MSDRYLKDLVAARLAEQGYSGTVEIRPCVPLAERLETGARALFIIEYCGSDAVRLVVDEWDIIGGTIGAPVANSLAERIERNMQRVKIAA